MILNLNELADGDTLQTDVCIVGAGAAGITLALELEDSGRDVLVLESGGFDFDPDTQDLYVGESVGVEYGPVDVMRLRYFGGTTNHWSGRCRAFDPIDFEARDWVPGSGWPFDRDHLVPFYIRAQPYVELGRFGYTLEELGDDRPVLPLGDDIDNAVAQSSPRTRFAETYRDRLDAAATIRVVLNANATRIDTDGADGPVTAIRVVSLQGRRVTLRARHFVLAAGGLEVPRLMLQPTDAHPNGIGNRHDQLGRWFADHPASDRSGEILQSEPHPAAALLGGHDFGDTSVSRFLKLSEAAQRREGLLQCRFELRAQREPLPREGSSGVESMRHLRDELAQRSWPEDLLRHLGAMVRDIDSVAVYTYHWLRREPPSRYELKYHGEPEPTPDSRVTLTDERDALGMRRLRVDWRLTEPVRHTFARGHELLGQAFGAAALGRVRLEIEPAELFDNVRDSYHPMGATRMHVSPRQGVVDTDGRVHGVPNLYVASSSVFPTYSTGSPTLTIVALAIRLADHLKTRHA
jgi:choline dehydrogenase-like flavoprotein